MNHTQSSKLKTPITSNPIMWGLLVAFLLAAGITAYLTFIAFRNLTASWNFTKIQGLALSDVPTNTPNALGTIEPNMPLQMPGGPTPQPWDGASRVTILVMGLDYGDWSADREGPSRTDTMILLTIDPLTRSAGMLNIPRDLWVEIPGFDYGKINTAYFLGEANKMPGGGPGLAVKTVEQFLGVPINFYAQVEFRAFERFIDDIGGVEIDVPAEIEVDPIGPHNTVILKPGKQVLDGKTALAYARNRYTEGGDFDRAQRQQQVVLAIRDKILTLNMLPTLIQKAPILYQEVASGVNTNMTLQQAIQLAWLVQQIPMENIKKGVISPPEQVTFDKSPDGLDILIPVPDKIRLLRDDIFTSTGPVSPAAATGDPKKLMEAENARISVLNGTYTAGLAANTMEYLKLQGINVAETGNAQELYEATTIIDYTGKPYTVQYLMQLMKVQPTHFYNSYDPNSQVDIVILLGNDWIVP